MQESESQTELIFFWLYFSSLFCQNIRNFRIKIQSGIWNRLCFCSQSCCKFNHIFDVIARIINRKDKVFLLGTLEKMIKYSWPITIAGLAGIINETFDRQFLKFLLPEDIGRHELGVYGGVAKVVTFVILFRQAYSLGIEPFF
jgi:hypothetical protein